MVEYLREDRERGADRRDELDLDLGRRRGAVGRLGGRRAQTGPRRSLGRPDTPISPGPTWAPMTGPISDTNSTSRP